MRIALAALAGFLLAGFEAQAGCRWEWVCDAAGHCEQAPICDSPIDVVPPEPPGVRPIVPPSVEPPAPPAVPPPGTIECDQVRRCDAYGNCFWDTVCY